MKKIILIFCFSVFIVTSNAESIIKNPRDQWKMLPTMQDKRQMLSQYSEQECVLFWEDKIQQVLTDFEWSAEEELFLNNMVDTIKIHPEWFSKNISEDILKEQKVFYYELLEYAMYGLNWSKELIWDIFYTGEDLVRSYHKIDRKY